MHPRPPLHKVTGSSAPRDAHAARPSVRTGPLLIGLIGAAVVIVAAALAAAILLKSGGPVSTTPSSAQLITVTAVTTSARP